MTSLKFGVSTTAFRNRPLDVAVAAALKHGFALEFSSGLPNQPNMRELYLAATCDRLPHNYFPAPAQPFVLNLASGDPDVLHRSRRHCMSGLDLAAKSGSPCYSVHAGFCIDVAPEALGSRLDVRMSRAREEHWAIFLESVRCLSFQAQALGVLLLIENNVLASFNRPSDGLNPLLCVDPGEICSLIEQINSPALGVLLDTGHWKVSAAVLGFPQQPVLAGYERHVHVVHHSDNDGLRDDNLRLGANYWFLTEMPRFAHALHVLEVHDQSVSSILRQRNLLSTSLS